MKTASSIYKILRTAKTSWYEWQVVRGNTIYGLDKLKSLSISQMLCSNSGMEIGNANSTECRLKLIEDSINWERTAKFTLQFRICNESGANKSEWITFGSYYTDVRSEDRQGNLSIIAYDAMMKTEDSWVNSIPESSIPASFPITARAWATLIQNEGLVTFDDITQLNDTVAFIGLDTAATIREILKTIATVHGGNWFVTPSETFKLIKFENVSSSDTNKFSNLNLSIQRFENSPAFDAVTGVHLETEGGTVMEAGTTDGYVVKAICSVSTTVGIPQICFVNVGGYVYRPFTAYTAYLDPIVDVGDSVSIDGTIYQVMTANWTIGKTPVATISAPFDQEIDHEFVTVDAETKAYRKGLKAINDATAQFYSAIEQTAEEIKATVSASQKQYDTENYTVELFGYEPPSTTQYPPADHNGEYYLNQADGTLYVSDGTAWTVVKTLQLINVKQDSTISQQATDISAKVSKEGGSNSTNSFSWVLNDSGHRWYANGAQDPIVSITGSGLSVTGEIKATSGYIGNGSQGFEINATNFHNGMTSLSDTTHNGVYIGTDGIALGKGAFKVTSSGAVTATDMNITGGSISITDGNGNVIFSANSSGVTVNGNGRFTGTVYAGNIVSEQSVAGAGYFNGSGIATGSIVGGISGGVVTGQLSSGVCQSLGYADFFNASTVSGTSTYPAYFTAGSLYAISSVASRVFSVENSSGEEVYHLNDHYHSFTEQDGKIVIGIPHNRTSIADRSFNIADTQTYLDGVAAVTVASRAVLYCNATNYTDFDTGFDCDMSGSSYHYEVNGVSYGRLEVRNSTGTGLKTIRVKLPASSSGSSATVQTVTSIAATSSNYNTYDKAIAPSFASLYTSGNYSYGLANISLSNGVNSILQFRVPAVSSITVARPYGDKRDWDLSEEYHVYVNVNLSASSGSTVLATNTGRVNVDDIVNFFAINTGAVIATNASNYGTYDQTFYIQNFLYTSGNYQYARIQLRNSDGDDLDVIRVQLDVAGSSSGSITITNEETSSSVNPYYGTLPYYAYVNNKHYVYVRAVSTGTAERTQYIDINDIVNYAYQLGGGGSVNSYYYWSDEKTGPYGSKQRDCYFVINGSIAHTAKVIWSSGNPSFQ